MNDLLSCRCKFRRRTVVDQSHQAPSVFILQQVKMLLSIRLLLSGNRFTYKFSIEQSHRSMILLYVVFVVRTYVFNTQLNLRAQRVIFILPFGEGLLSLDTYVIAVGFQVSLSAARFLLFTGQHHFQH